MSRVYTVEQFMRNDSMNEVPRAKIKSLFEDIFNIYKGDMRQNAEGKCDICGKQNTDERYRVKDIITGYENRPDQSPRLCYNHFCGWNISFTQIERDTRIKRCLEAGVDSDKIAKFKYEAELKAKYGMTNEEVDLHFAMYLTKQLMKEVSKQKIMEESK
jgi:hypothetical protein